MKNQQTLLFSAFIVTIMLGTSLIPAQAEAPVPKASVNLMPHSVAMVPANNYLLLEDDTSTTVLPTAFDDQVLNQRTSDGYLYKHQLLHTIMAKQQNH